MDEVLIRNALYSMLDATKDDATPIIRRLARVQVRAALDTLASTPAELAFLRRFYDDWKTGKSDSHLRDAADAFEDAGGTITEPASAPAGREAAFRAGAEAMQRALADVLRDHLNPRAAAIANSTPLPEYPA